MFKSIKWKITFIILIINIILLGTIITISYSLSSNITETKIQERLMAEVGRVSNKLDTFFQQNIQIGADLKDMEETLLYHEDHKELIEQAMQKMAARYDFISSLSIQYTRQWARKLGGRDYLMYAAAIPDGKNTVIVPYEVFNFPDSPTYNPEEFSIDYHNPETGYYYDFETIKKPIWADVLYEEVQKVFIVSYLVPVFDRENNVAALVSVDIIMDKLNTILSDLNLAKGSYGILVQKSGKLAAHTAVPDLVKEGKTLKEATASSKDENLHRAMDDVMAGNTGFVATYAPQTGVDVWGVYTTMSTTEWHLLVVTPIATFLQDLRFLGFITAIIALIGLAISILAAYLTANSIAKPIKMITRVTENLAAGDLTFRNSSKRKDEIGRLLNAFDMMSTKLREVTNRVRSGAETLAQNSHQLNTNADQISSMASEQAASTEEVAASVEEMNANITQNNDNAQTTKNIAQTASTNAEESGRITEQAMRSMKNIAAKITVIEEIAKQTNMLALNAAIEAARAGVQGKGFAVVASEVRKLAERSQNAASEIGELSSTTSKEADRVSQKLNQLVPNIKKTADLVQEIAFAGTEQQSGVQQINTVINQLEQGVQANAASSEQLASSATLLSQEAESLERLMDFFKTE